MSAELIGILSVGVALAALTLTSIKGLREDMWRIENRLDALVQRVDTLKQRLARLEGVLDGLREALFGKSREAAG